MAERQIPALTTVAETLADALRLAEEYGYPSFVWGLYTVNLVYRNGVLTRYTIKLTIPLRETTVEGLA